MSERFWKRDSTPGLLLILATVLSFALANVPALQGLWHWFHTDWFSFQVMGVSRSVDPHLIVNDGLMTLFFVYVGLELKRETVAGPFRNPSQAVLPIAAALGGMIVPAALYLVIAGPTAKSGWAIPAATDIAFAIGVLSLLGKRTPSGLRLFLLALAVLDDIGAIVVIALFYAGPITSWALGGMVVTFILMMLAGKVFPKALWVLAGLGVLLWFFTWMSGIHPTIAGVLAALAVPMEPLKKIERAIKPYVHFGVMPVFALANAGVALGGGVTLLAPVSLAVFLGLVVGKPVGVVAATVLASVVMKKRPSVWGMELLGLGTLAGIGFTMSLFVTGLAFKSDLLQAEARFGIVCASFVSAVLGLGLVSLSIKRATRREESEFGVDEDVAEDDGLLEDIDEGPDGTP